MIAGVALLRCSGFSGESDFEYGQYSFLSDCDESLLSGLIDINNLFLSDMDDLVQSLHFSPHNLGNPQRAVHESLGSLDGDKGFALSEEESEGSGDVPACISDEVP